MLTTCSFLNGPNDDPRLPFSVLDPIVGDVFSVLWEPEMIQETGSALKILTGEVLTQIGQTVLQATVMTALMSALQWPISACQSLRTVAITDAFVQSLRSLDISSTTPGIMPSTARRPLEASLPTCSTNDISAYARSLSSASLSVLA